jgi:hypothetical protein
VGRPIAAPANQLSRWLTLTHKVTKGRLLSAWYFKDSCPFRPLPNVGVKWFHCRTNNSYRLSRGKSQPSALFWCPTAVALSVSFAGKTASTYTHALCLLFGLLHCCSKRHLSSWYKLDCICCHLVMWNQICMYAVTAFKLNVFCDKQT